MTPDEDTAQDRFVQTTWKERQVGGRGLCSRNSDSFLDVHRADVSLSWAFFPGMSPSDKRNTRCWTDSNTVLRGCVGDMNLRGYNHCNLRKLRLWRERVIFFFKAIEIFPFVFSNPTPELISLFYQPREATFRSSCGVLRAQQTWDHFLSS